MKGLAISCDGIDSSGKTTMTALVVQHLWDKLKGTEIVQAQQPGCTPVGKELRRIVKDPQYVIDPVSERLLFCADNSVFINTLARPAVAAGKVVVSDRWSFITDLCYGIANGRPLQWLDRLQAFVDPMPLDLYIVLQCPWSIAKTRKIAAVKQNYGVADAGCRIEAKGDAFMGQVSEIYGNLRSVDDTSVPMQSFVPSELETLIWRRTKRIVCIDAMRNMEDVRADVFKAVDRLIDEQKPL